METDKRTDETDDLSAAPSAAQSAAQSAANLSSPLPRKGTETWKRMSEQMKRMTCLLTASVN